MPRHISEAQKARAIAKLEENWSLSEVAAELNSLPEQRCLKQCGFKNCVAAHKVFLTEEHKQRRVQFANEFLQGNEFWNSVVFSDEKTFQSSKNGRLRVYRLRDTRFEENYTLCTTIVAAFRSSVRGLKSSRPAMLRAVTSSGDVTKQWVAGLASLRPVKLRFASKFGEHTRYPVPLDGSPHLLGARCHVERYGRLDAVRHRLLGYAGAPAHVLVGAVGAGADQADLDLVWPAVLLGVLTQLTYGIAQVGSEWAVNVGLQGGQKLFCKG
ncbi:hypothetical protein NQ318_014079 [Aromia moschata]|uniref:Transposase Tc1-like domain-containing protein n=1 Tax=Aromia moschata TaxID=1265417 RepID=A0AAV8YYK5_9CUCU|nr:hypothetical protein NQ318_014079 [Aromia moschata]